MPRLLHVLTVCFVLGAQRPTLAVVQDTWLQARSEHFIVVSNASEEKTRETALQFERLRATFGRVIANPQRDLQKPVAVMAVRSEASLRELLPQFWERKRERPVGAYARGPHHDYIVLRVDARERELLRRAIHEHVHLLARDTVPHLPAWLDEGLSEFWASAVFDNNGVNVGRPLPHHLRVLRSRRSWIPIGELLAMERAPDARDKQKLSMFYAQSWALIHYVMLSGSSSTLEFAPAEYIEQLRQGENPVRAASLAFGDLSHLHRAVAAYVRAGRFRSITLQGADDGPPEGADGPAEAGHYVPRVEEIKVRALSRVESLVARARFLVDGERSAAALPLLTEAVRLEPNEPSALETLGRMYFQQNKLDEAAEWFDRSIETGAATYLAYFYRGILESGPAEDRAKAEDHLQRAIDLKPDFAEAHMRLADLYIKDAGRIGEAAPLICRAIRLEPDNPSYRTSLAKLCVNFASDALTALCPYGKMTSTCR